MSFQWLEALHVICMVTWFAGLFYLPRLFVYHASTGDEISNQRFKIMEKRLYYYITTPGAILTTGFGFCLLSFHYEAYSHMMWLHIKLILVASLWLYHFCCGYIVYRFKINANPYSEKFYRFFNEYPTLILLAVIFLVYLRPWS